MALSASTNLPADPQRVAEIFTDEAFVRHVSEKVGGSLESLTVDGDVAGAFTLTAVRSLPANKLPDLAKKFVSGKLTVTQTEKWEPAATDGARTANISLKVSGVPVDATAVQRLVPVDEGTRVELEGNVTSSIPFLGGKIADAAEPKVGKALNVQATEARSWLAQG
ncbi:DUF2505 domain-containing protein [Arthrobacter castelli]|uniref:DUF2505 domain-containing protein n=1 Tax=Arthrobacter castelli TaxID=271431 RepID=UPI0004127AD8|nr:DUF2505 domain-containing protein [Arthrobacter castelli]